MGVWAWIRCHSRLPFEPEAEVEWSIDGSVKPPSDPYVTQVVRADANGVLSYAMPHAGWWGFAALLEGAPRPGPDGKEGALIWVQIRDMK